MFSGLVEDLGTIQSIHKYKDVPYAKLRIASKRIVRSVRRGDSVAVNGVCLTVCRYSLLRSYFEVEILHSSLKKTSLGSLTMGDRVNLESSLRIGDKLGGHFVLGHVESTGIVLLIQEQAVSPQSPEVNRYFTVGLSKQLMQFMIAEGSVALDGISLTIAKRHQDSIEVNIIPHTYEHTNLCQKKQGDLLNVEADMFVKYLAVLGKRGFKHELNEKREQ